MKEGRTHIQLLVRVRVPTQHLHDLRSILETLLEEIGLLASQSVFGFGGSDGSVDGGLQGVFGGG